MLNAHLPPPPAADTSLREFTVGGVFRSGGRTLPYRQCLTSDYALVELDGSTQLHAPWLGGRFLVDRERSVLHRLDDESRQGQLTHLKVVLGNLHAERADSLRDVHGFPCRRHALRNDNARLSIAVEAWCTRVQGIERTMLHQERIHEARVHPFSLPLDPDEVVVRSVTRTIANGVVHLQVYRLLTIAPGIDDRDDIDRILSFPIMNECGPTAS